MLQQSTMHSLAGKPCCFRSAPRLFAKVVPVLPAMPGSRRKGVVRADDATERAFKNRRYLQDVGFTVEQAQMILTIFTTTADLVKKSDLDQLKTELTAKQDQLRTEVTAKQDQVKTELTAKQDQLKIELSTETKLQSVQMSRTLILIAMGGLLLGGAVVHRVDVKTCNQVPLRS